MLDSVKFPDEEGYDEWAADLSSDEEEVTFGKTTIVFNTAEASIESTDVT